MKVTTYLTTIKRMDADANGYRRRKKMSDEQRQKTANLVSRIMSALAEEYEKFKKIQKIVSDFDIDFGLVENLL